MLQLFNTLLELALLIDDEWTKIMPEKKHCTPLHSHHHEGSLSAGVSTIFYYTL